MDIRVSRLAKYGGVHVTRWGILRTLYHRSSYCLKSSMSIPSAAGHGELNTKSVDCYPLCRLLSLPIIGRLSWIIRSVPLCPGLSWLLVVPHDDIVGYLSGYSSFLRHLKRLLWHQLGLWQLVLTIHGSPISLRFFSLLRSALCRVSAVVHVRSDVGENDEGMLIYRVGSRPVQYGCTKVVATLKISSFVTPSWYGQSHFVRCIGPF